MKDKAVLKLKPLSYTYLKKKDIKIKYMKGGHTSILTKEQSTYYTKCSSCMKLFY